MLRRIEVRFPIGEERVTEFWFGAASFSLGRLAMERLGLPAPEPEDLEPDSFFWFTEEGWEEFGKPILHVLEYGKKMRYPSLEIRVVTSALSEVEVQWSDLWQVAVKDQTRFAGHTAATLEVAAALDDKEVK
jgi:hypothetical protein